MEKMDNKEYMRNYMRNYNSKKFYCEVCDKSVVKSCQIQHCKSIKHNKLLAIKKLQDEKETNYNKELMILEMIKKLDLQTVLETIIKEKTGITDTN